MLVDIDMIMTNLTKFISDYDVTNEELAWLFAMAENGQEQEAVDIFMEEYINAPSRQYQQVMMRFMGLAEEDELPQNTSNRIIKYIASFTVALTGLLTLNFRKFLNKVYGPVIFKNTGITDNDLKNTIRNSVLSQYEMFINGAMSQTQPFIINSIRNLQREMIVERLKIKDSGITGIFLEAEIKKFKQLLKTKYPDIYQALQKGNLLISRKFGPDGETVRHYRLDYYMDMTTRTTLLNVDRTSNTAAAIIAKERVMEFYLSDIRSVIKDREICKKILAKKVFGMSILALDDEAARILGVMTIDEAENTPDFSFGVNCRHSVRRCSKDYLDSINKLLEKAA